MASSFLSFPSTTTAVKSMSQGNSNKPLLLEINLISAQQLKQTGIAREMYTYAVAWINPQLKLRSRTDMAGRENPTWNDKFVFMIDEKTLRKSNSALVFEIYSVRSFGAQDKLVGTSRVLLDTLVGVGGNNRYCEGLRGTFKSFYVRRPSGRPHGILNIGVITLEGSNYDVMSEFVRLRSGVDYRRLTGGSNSGVVDKNYDLAKKKLGIKKNEEKSRIHECPYVT
ncbi:C2 domain [Dillenia turbinata]|uniref:C2 domain n=1 Tax=Dillenia turbinata TaxID=194707 RepID=A0AAN8WFI9_9MAGN